MQSTYKQKLYLDNISLFCIAAFPFAMITGPFLSEILMNIVSIIFIYEIFKEKKLHLLNNSIFKFFCFFFFFLIISSLLSPKVFPSIKTSLLYFRFFIFSFAIQNVLLKNNYKINYIYIAYFLIFFVLMIDSYYQFFNQVNLLGYKIIRQDRISSFFREDLILGSYIIRFLPVYFGLILFFNIKYKKFYIINILNFFLLCLLIILSGERSSTVMLTIFLAGICVFIKFRFKFFFLITLILGIIIFFATNPILGDRYYKQTVNQVFSKKEDGKIYLLENYNYLFGTSIKMFLDNFFLGIGPKNYRNFCNNKKYETFKHNYLKKIDNNLLTLDLPGKHIDNILLDIYIKRNEFIKKGDLIAKYKSQSTGGTYDLRSTKEGKVLEVVLKKGEHFNSDRHLATLILPNNIPNIIYKKVNGCTTHPHNYYIQLLGETGLIGFLFVIFLLIKIIMNLFKIFITNKLNSSVDFLSTFNFIILLGLFSIMWPINTSGNFFNNWINMSMYYVVGFYLFTLSNLKNPK